MQDDPNILKFTELNSSTQIITRASDAVSDLSIQSSRVAAGHPEGFFEAFANIYTEFADSIQANLKKNKKDLIHPTVNDGVMGIKFIFAAKKCHPDGQRFLILGHALALIFIKQADT